MTRIIRGITLSSLMNLGMAVAHIMGGGAHELTVMAPFVFLISSVFFAYLSPKRLEGPVLASYILGFQILGHLSFTSSPSDVRMSLSHIVAACLTFALVLHFEELIVSVRRYFRTLFLIFSDYPIRVDAKKLIFLNLVKPLYSSYSSKISSRAPPVYAAN